MIDSMKIVLVSLLLIPNILFARDIEPSAVFTVPAIVSDFAVDSERLFVGTDMGVVYVFDMKSAKLLYRIALEPVKDGVGRLIPARILSVDAKDGSLLVVSVGEGGFRDVWLYRDHILKKVVESDRGLYIKEARFADGGRAVLGTFGSEVLSYSLGEGYESCSARASESTIGDIAVSDDGSKILFSDEAGSISILDGATLKTVSTIDSAHLDKVHSVAYEKGVLVSGGHDRRVGVHFSDSSGYYIKSDFPVFCVGLSPDAKIGVFLSGDDQALQLFDLKSGKLTDRLVGHGAIVNQIRFVANRVVLTSERGGRVFLWRLDAETQ